MTTDLYALDFDGVLCDSCGESSLSALKAVQLSGGCSWGNTMNKAAKLHWPSQFEGVTEETEEWILTNMRTVRPVVETGYENVLLVRLLLELKSPQLRTSCVPEGLDVGGILSGWEGLKPLLMEAWQQDKEELVHLFGDLRDQWMASDMHGWIHANRFYPSIADALRFSSSVLFIVTTKQARFAEALLKDLAALDFPETHIFGLGTGPKVEVLQKIEAMPEYKNATLHFVEDRLATLKNVIKTPELDKWNIYLGDWGYNTPGERAEAASIPRIQMLDLPSFCAKLK